MLSMLFMTTFSETDPMLFAERPKADLFGRVLIGPQMDIKNPNTVTTLPVVDAVASVKKGEKDDRAQTYFNDLTDARKTTQLARAVTVGDFSISHFGTKTGNALLKFCKTTANATKKILTCVIDLASVKKNETQVSTADQVSASWLNYFWELWHENEKGDTFKTAKFTAATQKQIDVLADENAPKDGPYSLLKGFFPRQFAGLNEAQIKEAKQNEVRSWALVLLRMQNQGLNIKPIMGKFQLQHVDLLKTLEAEIPGITTGFNSDDNKKEESTHTQGHKLNLEWWKIIGEDTLLPIAKQQLSPEAAEALVVTALANMKKTAEKYKKV